MALIKTKPTSPGTRFVVKVGPLAPAQGRPVARAHVERRSAPARATTSAASRRATRAAATSQQYRLVDFQRDKDGIPGKVERLEYDPNRTAHLALVLYADGERRYILAPKGVKAGDEIRSGTEAPIKAGNALPLRNIPVGTHGAQRRAEARPGGQLARSAGGSAQLVAREGIYATMRLRSGEMRKVHVDCRATIGEVGNDEHNLRVYGKAGAMRWRGIRPTVRGVVMNPVDHPHGGGEGKSGQGNPHPVSPVGLADQGQEDAHATSARPA